MSNCCRFSTLFVGDIIKSIPADLFVGVHQFILNVHVYSILVSLFVSLIFLCLYLDGSFVVFVSQKFLGEARLAALSCLHHKKLLKTLKLPNIYTGLVSTADADFHFCFSYLVRLARDLRDQSILVFPDLNNNNNNKTLCHLCAYL